MHVSELGIIEVNEAPPPLELTPAEIAALADELMHYHAAFAELYYRAEQAHWALKYLQGLLLPIERKSIEPMALALEGGNVQAMQQFSDKGSGRILRCCENTGPWGTRPWGQPTAYGSPMVRTFPSKGSIRSGEPASGAATWGRSRIVRRACLPRMTLCLLADHFLVHARQRVKKGRQR